MATITKNKPEYFKQASSNNWAQYSSGSFTCPTDWNKLFFQYQTAMGTITSFTVKFRVVSNKNAGQDTATFIFRFSANGDNTGSWYSKQVSVSGYYEGEVSATFTFSGGLNIVPNISLNVYQYGSGNTFSITPAACTIVGTQQALSCQINVQSIARTILLGEEATVVIRGRYDADIRIKIEVEYFYGSSYLDAINKYYDITDISASTYTFQPTENWFNLAGNTSGSVRIRVTVSDTAGRSWYDSNIFLHREMFTLSVDNQSAPIDTANALTITDPYSRLHDLTVYSCYSYYGTYKKTAILLSAQGVSAYYEISIPENAFVQAQQRGQELLILAEVSDADGHNRSSSIVYKLTRESIGVMLNAYVDVTTDPITNYAETGSRFRLQFFDRYDRELTVKFTSNGAALKDAAGISNSWAVQDDIASFDCLKRWFDDASDVNNTVIPFTVTVSDEMLRETVRTWEVRAGTDMNPIISVSTTPIQQASWPSELDPYYVQGYTRIKFEAMVAAQTNAPIMAVSLSSNQIGSLQLLYNNVTGKYETESQAPLIADTDYVITATDKRGLSSVTQSSTVPILLYAFPNITVDSYHRCQSDKTPDDSGAYCHLIVTYVFSALNNLNSKDTSVSTTDYTDERTLSSYTSQEEYLFPANIERSYQIVLAAEDLLNSTSKTIVLSTADVIMDFLAGGKGIGLGKVAELSKYVEVNPEWKFKVAAIELNGRDLGTLLATIMDKLDIQ